MSEEITPVTYWERRSLILENVFIEALKVLVAAPINEQDQHISDLITSWDDALDNLESEFKDVDQ